MGRKLVKQGHDALTVTLPRKWLNRFGLNAGDEIDLEEQDDKLIFYAKKNISKKKSSLDVTGHSDKIIYTMLNFMYIRGDDEIEIKFSNQKELLPVKKIINSLIGYVVIKETNNTCIIKDMSGAISDDIDEVIKRIFTLVNGYIEDAILDVSNGCKLDEKGIISRDRDINKLVSLALRTLNKKAVVSKEHSQALFNIITHLEHLGDNIGRFWRTASNFKLKIEPSLLSVLNMSKESVLKLFEIYYNFNDKKIENIVKLRDKARDFELTFSSKNASQIRIIRYAIEICEECVDMMHSVFIIRL